MLELRESFNEAADREIKFLAKPGIARRYSQGDKLGKALAWLINRERNQTWIEKIISRKGSVLISPADINGEFAGFYESLCLRSSDRAEDEASRFLNGLDLPSLTSAQIMDLDLPIQLSEVVKAIEDLNAGKAPGSDGFTAEFYKHYIDLLVTVLLGL